MSGSGTLLARWKLLIKMTTDPGLSRADLSVGSVLLDLAGYRGFAWPSLPTLAARSGQSLATVKRSIARLEATGYFQVAGSRGRGNANTYRPLFEALENSSPVSPITSHKTAHLTTENSSSHDRKQLIPVQKNSSPVSPQHMKEEQVEEQEGKQRCQLIHAEEDEADSRAAFYAREPARQEAHKRQLQDLSTKASSEPRTRDSETAEDASAPPHSPSPRAAAGGFSVHELSFPAGKPARVVRHGEFSSVAEARARRDQILADQPLFAVFRVEIRDSNGSLLSIEEVGPRGGDRLASRRRD